jgi:hypothetical protein
MLLNNSDHTPARIEEKYPTARVPGALTLADVFAGWEAAGLTPVEVSTEDLAQRINIEYNALTTQLKWTTDNMDGVQALGIMADAFLSMFSEFFKAKPRPKFSSGQARVMVNLDGNQLAVALDPLHDPTVVKGVLGAALAEVITRSRSDDPVRDWLKMWSVDISS